MWRTCDCGYDFGEGKSKARQIEKVQPGDEWLDQEGDRRMFWQLFLGSLLTAAVTGHIDGLHWLSKGAGIITAMLFHASTGRGKASK